MIHQTKEDNIYSNTNKASNEEDLGLRTDRNREDTTKGRRWDKHKNCAKYVHLLPKFVQVIR
jgi:hypothetical protein